MPKGTLAFSVTREDCDWQYFPAGKNGGQNANKNSTACRVTHRDSGARGESREYKSQIQNRKAAFQRMVQSKEFKLWVNRKLVSGPSPEEKVEKDMQPKNLKIEGREDGVWVPLSS